MVLAFSGDVGKSKFSVSAGREPLGPEAALLPDEEFPWDEFSDEEPFIEYLGEIVVSLLVSKEPRLLGLP